MNFELEKKWRSLVAEVSENFEETLDLQSIIFIIGLQELNLGYQKLKKDQKIEVMHIAICTLLEPYGYYEFVGKDDDGWPHFEKINDIPALNENEQEELIKEAIIDYFQRSQHPV
ncbi:hypothetical protein [Parvicella tangerina]|uniref:Uncharacterized protein n=1 Tax=Parvicella tangerina TaxID=2829795 RepID=A0A916JM00_9FLAO|nr:hypothetical protein [Parvicella tangerina]CAG5079822.1 hypothetical protein CRYO30217_01084 [Parvicella tangerina]